MEAYKLLESYNENLGGTDVPIVAGSSPTNGEDHGQ